MTYGYIPFPVVGPGRIQAPAGLPRVIIERTAGGCTKSYADKAPTINAPVASIAAAVESAYIITPKDELPKVTEGHADTLKVEEFGAMVLNTSTSEAARKRAAAWLAIAQHLQGREKAKAAEESVAKQAAEAARVQRLDELADEWFGKDYADLGPNKAAAVKEIHRLETKLNAKDAA